MARSEDAVPTSTQWLLDAAGDTGRMAIRSVYLLFSPETQTKGTAFLTRGGFLLTNWHVVKDSQIGNLVGIGSDGQQIGFKDVVIDENRDLAALTPTKDLGDGLRIQREDTAQVGMQVFAWGYPLGYNGPAPLLSVGYLSGFNDSPPYEETASVVKHLVVNGAFNPGNSGGPLFVSGKEEVIGVVVSKHFPLTRGVESAMTALANQRSGFMYSGTDALGNKIQVSEAQVVAQILAQFQDLSQVMIGEAISGSEVLQFLEEHGLET